MCVQLLKMCLDDETKLVSKRSFFDWKRRALQKTTVLRGFSSVFGTEARNNQRATHQVQGHCVLSRRVRRLCRHVFMPRHSIFARHDRARGRATVPDT